MELRIALLEEWMRSAYFSTEFDIGSSGVESFQLRELREIIDIDLEDLDQIVFHDSQTMGGDGLRRAIADRYAGGLVERVMVTHGSTEANYLLHLAMVNAGDEVIVLDPAYQQLVSLAEGLGARVKKWKLREEVGFEPQLEDFQALLTPETRLVIVNFPHNPTGATLTHGQFDEFLAMIRAQGAWLIWDAAFAELVYDGQPLPDPTATYERAISMGTLSKAFGLPGLRVGWCIAPTSILDKCIRLRDYISLHLSPLVEFLAQRVIEHADTVIQNRLDRARTNLAICKSWAIEQPRNIDWIAPRGGVSAFPRLRNVENVYALCRQLATIDRVLAVPGSCFGRTQHIRLGFGGNREQLQVGLTKLTKALE
jgi:capreomycidine synthase